MSTPMSNNPNDPQTPPVEEQTPTPQPVTEVQAETPASPSPETQTDVSGQEVNASQGEEPAAINVNYGPNEHVDMSYGSPLRVDPHRPVDDRYGKVSLSRMAAGEFRELGSKLSKDNIPPDSPEMRNWARAVQQAPSLFMANGAFESSLHREGSEWSQSMRVGAEHIRADKPKFGDNGTTKLVGEEARLRVRAAISAGARVRVPLWASGIWVTIKAATERELCELEERIGQQKIELGWRTDGLVFSNTSVYMADILVDFVLEHVSETSYQYHTVADLKKIILQPDYMQLVWGMLCAIYTDGYTYEQPCMLNPIKCSHVETARLSFGKMSFVDDRAFTDWQRQHMRKRNSASMPKLDVERYQTEHRHNRNNVKKLSDNLSVEFRVPTLDEYLQSGTRWVDGLIASVDEAFSRDMEDTERNAVINKQASVTLLRQYVHWIKMVALDNEDRYIDDQESLEEVIADLTSDDDIFKNFFDGIKTYIDSIIINVHGIPKYPCPACEGNPPDEIMKHPEIYPIDLAEMFFTLVGQRIRRMLTRRG